MSPEFTKFLECLNTYNRVKLTLDVAKDNFGHYSDAEFKKAYGCFIEDEIKSGEQLEKAFAYAVMTAKVPTEPVK